jgi:membrane protease subunit (stomatin/prohibitin family)
MSERSDELTRDYQNKTRMTSVGRCAGCGLMIVVGDYCEMLGLNYHANCFKCSQCHQNLYGKWFVPSDLPLIFCADCKPEQSVTVIVKDFRKSATSNEAASLSEGTGVTTSPRAQYISSKLCQHCRTLKKMGAKFCHECGAQHVLIPGQELRKPQPKEANTKFCIECGAVQPSTNAYCNICGTLIR